MLRNPIGELDGSCTDCPPTGRGRVRWRDDSGGGPLQPYDTTLRLIDKDGATQIRIYVQNETLILEKLGIGTANFSSKEVAVKDFKVYIWPASNPFPGGSQQPTAAIYLDLESNVNPRDKTRMKFQLSLATRQYPE